MDWKPLLAPRAPISRGLYVCLGIAGFAVILLVWWVLTAFGLIKPFFLPSPPKVMASGYTLFTQFDFLTDIASSTYRIFIGFMMAAVMGVPLGLLMGTFRSVEALSEPIVGFIRYMPASAFIPLFILWLGIGDLEKVAIIWVGSFFQLVLMVAVVAKGVPQEMLETGYTLGASRAQVLWRVLLPASLPGIVDTLRIIVGWAWTYIIVAELVASEAGIGYRILNSQRLLQTGSIIFAIITIGVLGLLTDLAFKWLHRKLFPWTE
jgi:NitT/TauT family transport system permease protein